MTSRGFVLRNLLEKLLRRKSANLGPWSFFSHQVFVGMRFAVINRARKWTKLLETISAGSAMVRSDRRNR